MQHDCGYRFLAVAIFTSFHEAFSNEQGDGFAASRSCGNHVVGLDCHRGDFLQSSRFVKLANTTSSGEVNDVSLGSWGLLKDLYLLECLSCDNS